MYEGCGRLQLCPLSPPQQRDLIRLALGGPAAPRPQVEALLEYVLRLPPGSDGQLIGASPLALQARVRVRARVGVCVCLTLALALTLTLALALTLTLGAADARCRLCQPAGRRRRPPRRRW